MERINLSVLSGVSHEGMLQLKSYVDMTGLDPQHQSYDYECLFPETCNPREICLSFIKAADGYVFRVNPHFRYDGNNSVMGILADTGVVSFSSWQDAEQALRTLTEEGTKPSTGDSNLDSLTDWDDISVPEQSVVKTPNFEYLKEHLQKIVIGQDDSTETIAYTVAQHLAKKNPTKPVSILASGPPGVGKSETAKALAKILSQDCEQEYAISWTDLNNFTEAFSVYRLIGAPAGYVGYEDEAVFEVVARNPYTIFIFDELDKAHPEVLKTFMAILDEGRCASRKALNDGSREFDFKHCIFFFTSNYDLSANQPIKRKIGFAVSDDIEDIHLAENEVHISYRGGQTDPVSDISLPMRIYRENEAARKAFVGVGVLREIASRFQCFVNFKPLSAKAKTRILAKQIIEMGFEYSHAISYVSPSIMQGLIDAAMSGDSLTIRSFKSVIEGYLAPVFARAEVIENRTYRLEGTLEEPQMIAENRAR